MIDVLVDTNIVIYAIRGERQFIECLNQFSSFGISTLTLMELFAGAHDPEEGLLIFELLHSCEIIALDTTIALAGAKMLREKKQKGVRSSHFADTVTACTALKLGVPLITNNPKDFDMFEGLKLITP